MLLHACIVVDALEHTFPFPKHLLQMYVTCAAHYDAHSFFASVPSTQADVVFWNGMLSSHHQCGLPSEALFSFQDMLRHGICPNRASFLIALSVCDSTAYLDKGQCLHFVVVLENMDANVVIGTALLSMYARCRSLEDAWDVFSNMEDRDIVTWNAIIAGFAQNGYAEEAFQLSYLLYFEGLIPNRATYLTLLDICGNYAGLLEGKKVHARLCLDDMILERPVGNAIINLYGRCGSIKDVREVFDSMVERDVVSWTSMMMSYVQYGLSMDALQSSQQMLLEGALPNQVTFVSVVSACTSIMALQEGLRVHTLVVGCGFESHNVIGNALINMYSKCKCLDLAQHMFERMHDRDVISWNSIIGASSQSSLFLFCQMLMEAFIPSTATYAAVLTAELPPSLAAAKWLHTFCISSGQTLGIVLVTALVSMYGKCGSVEEASTLFDTSTMNDLILYNAMIAALSQNGCFEDALQLFHLLQMKGMVPDKATFVSVLDACGYQEAIVEGKQIHVFIKGLKVQLDSVLGNALLTMYAKCGELREAQVVFDAFATRDVTTWNAMMIVLEQSGELNEAVRHFEAMQTEGIVPDNLTFASLFYAYGNKEALEEGSRMHARIFGSAFNEDAVVLNALINMYGKCGYIADARKAFSKISSPDEASWNALIVACAQCGQGEEALLLYRAKCLESTWLDVVTLTSILSALASESALAEGYLLHVYIVDIGLLSDISVGNALVSMYGKCGSLEDARHVFKAMETHDAISWNALIAVYGQHGHVITVCYLFWRMVSQGHVPDKVTLVSILTACSHAGLVQEGFFAFVSMSLHYDIKGTIDHYNCMIDLLGRAGRLHELEGLIKCMPMGPTCTSWMTLLGACNKHLDLERGEFAAIRVMDLQPYDCAPFVLLANMYASAGKWDDITVQREAKLELCEAA